MMTNEEINKLSDKQLAIAIAKALYIYHSDGNYRSVRVWNPGMQAQIEEKDYCNNWNDLMPLVVEYGIVHSRDTAQFHAHSYFYDNCKTSNNSLNRALAECLLKVLIEKNKTN